MALGAFTTVDFLNQAFGEGDSRLACAGEALLYIGAVLAIKADWAEFCNTMGFSNWATKLAPCLACFADWEAFFRDHDFGIGHSSLKDFKIEDYIRACDSCEIW